MISRPQRRRTWTKLKTCLPFFSPPEASPAAMALAGTPGKHTCEGQERGQDGGRDGEAAGGKRGRRQQPQLRERGKASPANVELERTSTDPKQKGVASRVGHTRKTETLHKAGAAQGGAEGAKAKRALKGGSCCLPGGCLSAESRARASPLPGRQSTCGQTWLVGLRDTQGGSVWGVRNGWSLPGSRNSSRCPFPPPRSKRP